MSFSELALHELSSAELAGLTGTASGSASGIAPTVAFGTAAALTVVTASTTGATPGTLFGAPVASAANTCLHSSSAPDTSFGAPVGTIESFASLAQSVGAWPVRVVSDDFNAAGTVSRSFGHEQFPELTWVVNGSDEYVFVGGALGPNYATNPSSDRISLYGEFPEYAGTGRVRVGVKNTGYVNAAWPWVKIEFGWYDLNPPYDTYAATIAFNFTTQVAETIYIGPPYTQTSSGLSDTIPELTLPALNAVDEYELVFSESSAALLKNGAQIYTQAYPGSPGTMGQVNYIYLEAGYHLDYVEADSVPAPAPLAQFGSADSIALPPNTYGQHPTALTTALGYPTASAHFFGGAATVTDANYSLVVAYDNFNAGVVAGRQYTTTYAQDPIWVYSNGGDATIVDGLYSESSIYWSILDIVDYPAEAGPYFVIETRAVTRSAENKILSLYATWAEADVYLEVVVDKLTGTPSTYVYYSNWGSTPANAGVYADGVIYSDLVSPIGSEFLIRVEWLPEFIRAYVNGTLVLEADATVISDNYTEPPNYLSLSYGGVKVDEVGIYAADAFGNVPATAGTNLGTPSLSLVCVAESVEDTTVVSPAYFSFNQVQYASGAVRTRYGGSHYVMATMPVVVHQTTAAKGFKSMAFGTATEAGAAIHAAQGFAVTSFGAAAYFGQFAILPIEVPPTTAFGSPYAVVRTKVIGWKSTILSTPFGSNARAASPLPPKTKFGMAKAVQPGAYPAYGFGTTRYGRHGSTNLFGLPANGWVSAVLGTPLGYSTVNAQPTATTSRFGRPTLRRNPTC